MGGDPPWLQNLTHCPQGGWSRVSACGGDCDTRCVFGGRTAFCPHVAASLAQRGSWWPRALQGPSHASGLAPGLPLPWPVPALPHPQCSLSQTEGPSQRKLFASERAGSALLFLFLDVVAVQVGTVFHRVSTASVMCIVTTYMQAVWSQ